MNPIILPSIYSKFIMETSRNWSIPLQFSPKITPCRKGEYFCADLRTLIDQLECICIQMFQQQLPYNTTSFQMEVEEKLPRFVLDEIFMAKKPTQIGILTNLK